MSLPRLPHARRTLVVAALAVALAGLLAAGVRAHVRAVEAASTHAWLLSLDASVRNVERRVESWKTNHERETALVASLVADSAGGGDAAGRLERARELLGASDLWVLDSAGA